MPGTKESFWNPGIARNTHGTTLNRSTTHNQSNATKKTLNGTAQQQDYYSRCSLTTFRRCPSRNACDSGTPTQQPGVLRVTDGCRKSSSSRRYD